MKKLFTPLFLVALLLAGSCKKDKVTPPYSGRATGYNFGTEDIATIPKALNTNHLLGGNATPPPSSYFLTQYLPPVGDQGQYGTCIGWASAYYTKTALEAIDKGWANSSQLALTSNQMSPKDLFTAIPDADKGANCDGTNFDAALTVMQTRGVATLQTIPYTNLGGCQQATTDPAGTSDAAHHKISNYRAMSDGTTADYISDIKQNISKNSPVLIGIGVGTGFENWSGSGVMTTGFDPCGGGQACGGHAQTIVGYDDSKGSGGAFRVVNSWNTTWGDNGFYWVDYNFMFNTLLQKDNNNNYCIFVANNGTSDTTQPVVNPTSSGVDLAPWVQEDDGLTPARTCYYNIYNIGNGPASSSSDWDLYYVYYNAYNANDYGVVFHDQFNTSVASGTVQCNGNSCVGNYDIPSGYDLGTVAFGSSLIQQQYTMPNVTGYYYLVLVADAGEVLNDVNYDNNIFYTSELPAHFTNGYFGKTDGSIEGANYKNTLTLTKEVLRKNVYNTAVNKDHPNAYTPQEILGFLKRKKETGELAAKVRTYDNSVSSGMSAK